MKKLEIEDAEIMRIAIQQEIRRSEEARYDHRLHGILLVAQGMNCCEVADILGQGSRTVERWVKQFNTTGFAGLSEGERTGRPRRIAEAQWEQIGRDLRKHPRELGYQQNLWDGPLLGHHIRGRFGIEVGVRQCQRMFRKMGFRRRKPRPLIAQADAEEQQAYKKTAPSVKEARR